jgi:hypothetical protein
VLAERHDHQGQDGEENQLFHVLKKFKTVKNVARVCVLLGQR